MLRITADLNSDPIVLKVEGKLKGPWVTELKHHRAKRPRELSRPSPSP